MNFGDNQRSPISALSASFDQDAMCYAMFPSLSVDPTYARLNLFFLILEIKLATCSYNLTQNDPEFEIWP